MNRFPTFLLIALAALICLPLRANAADNTEALKAISGLWYTQDRDGIVQLYVCGQKICGRMYWLKDDSPEDVSRDTHNPDINLRKRPLCQMQFMGGFAPDEQGNYNDGWIYSPRHGSTFNAKMKLIDHDTLDLHGYVLLPTLGESQTWKRAGKHAACTTDSD
jgi:uncharacterized protein (DUF2147 family)